MTRFNPDSPPLKTKPKPPPPPKPPKQNRLPELCAETGFGHYVVLHLPTAQIHAPEIAGPFRSHRSAWRALEWIENAFPAVAFRLSTKIKTGNQPSDFPVVRDYLLR